MPTPSHSQIIILKNVTGINQTLDFFLKLIACLTHVRKTLNTGKQSLNCKNLKTIIIKFTTET
jgi:hypothetical protein